MGNQSTAYWILLLVAIAAVVAAFFLRSSPDPHARQIAQYMGWGAIVLLVIARVGLRRRKPPEPPMPRD